MSAGLHDDPRIYPTLPPRAATADDLRLMVAPNKGTVWETCWEFVLTHDLTDRERAAFWTAANLVHEAMKAGRS